ncbi:alpha-ketoglutarate-dependent dioxygenase AlkB [Belliella sp. R4-6]|uniref:Alpha-ketoglutarate-dependent dioxygenase AlkB n=1 Tax=Belliella alkalica TaxID=1730871 RepID=A0ABS9VFF1_9BACT|nr:alpha-ketoglutarate-dependent dioxygenase AlkB [Belliella alkalica]MCH7415181.1 alpha-ketoglutarate-dependent dioxygenase AlkB [Belliella alkalica]
MNSLFNDRQPIEVIKNKGDVIYYPNFFPDSLSNELFLALQEDIEWIQEPIWMFGKKIMQPRLTALYGDPKIAYKYSGIEMQAKDWNHHLIKIKNSIEELCQTEFSHVLLNYYRDGQDSMGWHRDNERSLGNRPLIASVSFGTTREFQLRKYDEKQLKKSINIAHGSLLLMQGDTQQYWEHQLPKSKKIKNPRINLTFRKILG